MTEKRLQALRKELERYSLEGAITTAGALQVVPANSEHAVRLQMLALVAATTKNGTSKAFPPSLGSKLLVDGWLADLSQFEEPPAGAFVETVTFHGGGYRVFSGPGADSMYMLRSFLDIFTTERLVRDYSKFAVGLLTAALSVADLVASRAGLGTTVRAGDSRDVLEVPDNAALAAIKTAVSFSTGEIADYLSSRSMTLSTLAPLISGIGNVPGVLEVEGNPLRVTPIVQTKGRLIVAVPSALHTAAVHHALLAADHRGLNERLGRCFLDVSWNTVLDAMLRMDWAPTRLTPPTPVSLSNARDAVFAFDFDKLSYVLLLCDDMQEYTTSPSESSVDNDALTGRLIEIEDWIAGLQPTTCELQIVVVVAGVGRYCAVRPDSSALKFAQVLAVSAADFEVMSLLEKDPLGVWKFLRAAKALRKTTQVGPSLYGPLNEFWYYLDREHSYYFSEEAIPDFMLFDGAGEGLAREEVALNEDRHAVVGPLPTSIVEVTRCQKTGSVYARRQRNVLREFCVCTSTLPVWIVSAVERDVTGRRQGDGPAKDNGAIHLACRAAAFWVAELVHRTEDLIDTCVRYDRLLVRVHIDDLRAFDQRLRQQPEGPLVRVEVDSVAGTMTLTLTNAFAWFAAYRDNRSERALVQEYLRGLHQLARGADCDVTDAAIGAVVDEVAPLGFKRQITLTEKVDDPQLDPRALPPLRLVRRADEQLLLDTLGRQVIDSLQLATGDLSSEAAHRVLHGTVAVLYGELERRIATLCPIGLLESLLAANEALVRQEAEKGSTLAARIACAENSQEMLTEVRDESVASAKAAVAMRFLIEYVAARPPTGFRRASTSVLDELLAMASMLVFLGTVGDVSEFKIADIHVAVLASRRIHVDSGEFNAAMQSYLSIAAGRDLDRARGERQRTRVADIREQLKAAIASIYGVSSEQARSIIGALYEIGIEQHPSVAVFERAAVESAVAERVDVDPLRVRSMLEKLTLTPRAEFLKAPKPYDKHDVYPWRFGRGLSLLQRPLILRSWGGRERLTWGARQLWGAWHHAAYRIAHGAWRAPNAETEKLLSAINDARGYIFEEEVAETLRRERTELSVRERVTKLQGRRIELGDIDVLVASQQSKRLWLLECKDLSRAATPWSIKNQLKDLFVDRAKEKSIQAKHEARVEWARGQVRELLSLLGLSGDGWDVRGAIVTAVELVAPLLQTARMPVIPWSSVADFDF